MAAALLPVVLVHGSGVQMSAFPRRKSGRHHADHRVAFAVKLEGLAKDVGSCRRTAAAKGRG